MESKSQQLPNRGVSWWLPRFFTSKISAVLLVLLIVSSVRTSNETGTAESQALIAFGAYTFIQILFARRDSRMTRSFTPDSPASLAAYCGNFLFGACLLLAFSGALYIGVKRKPGDEFLATLPILFAIQTVIIVAQGFIADWRAEQALRDGGGGQCRSGSPAAVRSANGA